MLVGVYIDVYIECVMGNWLVGLVLFVLEVFDVYWVVFV